MDAETAAAVRLAVKAEIATAVQGLAGSLAGELEGVIRRVVRAELERAQKQLAESRKYFGLKVADSVSSFQETYEAQASEKLREVKAKFA